MAHTDPQDRAGLFAVAAEDGQVLASMIGSKSDRSDKGHYLELSPQILQLCDSLPINMGNLS